MERTIPNLFEESVKKFPNNIIAWQKLDNHYSGTSYKELQKLIYLFAAGLLSEGLKKGDRCALISEGRNDWIISELAILYCGAVNVPISVKVEELSDLEFRINHSECKFVIVSQNHLHKIREIKERLPSLEKTIILDNILDRQRDEIIKDDLFANGKQYFLEHNQDEFQKNWQSIKENDIANICYTSGTTADPKGIILSHRNYTANVEQATALLPIPEWYTSLLILPWDHSFAHTAGIYTLMKNGASMASIKIGKTPLETLKNIPQNIKETKPVFLLSVPALAKNFKKNIESGIKAKGNLVVNLFNFALKVSYQYNKDGFTKGSGLSWLKFPLVKLFDKILFSKIREGFGGRLKFFIGGGALLDIELQRFFYAIGIPMFQGYGLSEAAPIISANVPDIHKLGSSGKPVVNLELKIVDENGKELPIGEKGEIIVRGENVMLGYWKNPSATSETIIDGWLYTGDLGYLDNDGFLYVLGRSKCLLISNDGEKYSPEGIEEALCDQSKFIEQAMLYNDQSPYTVALLYLNKENIKSELIGKNLEVGSPEFIQAVMEIISHEINKYRNGGEFQGQFPERWLPSAVAILEEGFTEENHLLNTTLKMVRGKITQRYRERIDDLYSAEGKSLNNKLNEQIVSRW